MNAIKKHTRRLCPLFFILSASIALMSFGSPAPTWEVASDLFAKGRWAEAEKALDAYAVQTPTPSHRAEAFVLEARCREKRRNVAGARKIYESLIRDESLRRASPSAVADAYNRLHALLVADAKAAPARRRLVDDAKRRISGTPALSRILEREGDALLASGDIRGARAAYADAPFLTAAGTNVSALIRAGFSSKPPPLSEKDIDFLGAIANAKPRCVGELCSFLARRPDGWMAEDFHARHLLRSGEPQKAAAIWDGMARGGRGPSDMASLSRAEALAAANRAEGLSALGDWLASHRDSPLRERAEAQYGIQLAAAGKYAAATNVLGVFIANHKASPYAKDAAKALSNSRKALDARERAGKERRAAAEARQRDPIAADIAKAESLLAAGKNREALPLLESAVLSRGHALWGRAGYALGRSRRALGDTKGALEAWDDVWRRGQADAGVLCAAESRRAYGDAMLEDMGDAARAVKAYGEALARNPSLGTPSLDLNRGLALAVLGRHGEAADIFNARRSAFDAVGDKAEAQRWGNLAALAMAGGLAPPPHGVDAKGRKAAADIALADGLLAAGEPKRALRLYRRAMAEGTRHDDRATLGAATCLGRLGRARDALALYAHFRDRLAGSDLAPRALLQAGTLTASPHVGDSAKARKWFALCAERHPGTREAMAADFYVATLAWWAGRWKEAERLHRAFAANYPGTELALHVENERLPAIVARKARSVDRTVKVTVWPNSHRRKAIPIEKTTAFCADLEIRPRPGYSLRESHIADQEREDLGLWTGPDPKRPDLHTYHLSNAFSSQEYVYIRGRFETDVVHVGERGYGLPPFDVTVPAVDVDWEGFDKWEDETEEEIRHVCAPVTEDRAKWKRILIPRPWDNEQLVAPWLRLSWTPADAASMLGVDDRPFPNGGRINCRGHEEDGGHWPIVFSVRPEKQCAELKITLVGEKDDGTPIESAIDNIYGTLVNVDLVGYAAWRGSQNKEVPDDEEFEPGFLVTVKTNGHLSAKLKFKAVPNTSLRRYYKFSQKGLILVDNASVATSGELEIPGNADYFVNVDMDELTHWGENTTHVDVEYIVKDAGGNVIGTDKCRLLRPFVVAIGDSLTYGVWNSVQNGNGCTNVPIWKYTEELYPTASVWADPTRVTPPNNKASNRMLLAYQGYRGYLAQKLPGFTWLGEVPNDHGPSHNGYPGAKIHSLYTRFSKNTLKKSPSYTFVVYFAGMNNCNRGESDPVNNRASEADWLAKLEDIKIRRTGKGRTIILALKLPPTKANPFFNFNFANLDTNIEDFNKAIVKAQFTDDNYVIIRKVNSDEIKHSNFVGDSLDDDGMHFNCTKYDELSRYIFEALEEGLK